MSFLAETVPSCLCDHYVLSSGFSRSLQPLQLSRDGVPHAPGLWRQPDVPFSPCP